MVIKGPARVKSRQMFHNCDEKKSRDLLSLKYFIRYGGDYKFEHLVMDKNCASTIFRAVTMLDIHLKFGIFAIKQFFVQNL